MNLRENKPLLVGLSVVVVVVVAVLAVLAFGFFGIQSAFIDNEVDEAGPTFDSGGEAISTASEEEQDSTAETEEFQDAMVEAEQNATEADERAEDAMPGEISTVASGTFAGNSRYEIVGDISVLTDGTEQRFVRFENFESSNGPDLKVYLRAEDGSFVSLGDLKGNIGDQNYEIPVDVDLAVFRTVEIWCERFGVGFGSGTLA